MKKLLCIIITINVTFAGTFEAVCVGIDHYNNSYISDLSCSVANAVDMRDRLLDQGFHTVTLITNNYATQSNIFSNLEDMNRVAGNTCLYYHSGHGD
ncbi:MAG TPA: hypothetical protein DHW42_11595 [Candidatus Marinimicrobia bacterium]|nr:hypothetical protein [Candidatus Neomarinimicrobiota bacterium]